MICLAVCESQPLSEAIEAIAGTRWKCRNYAKPIFSVRIWTVHEISALSRFAGKCSLSFLNRDAPLWDAKGMLSWNLWHISYGAFLLLAKCFSIRFFIPNHVIVKLFYLLFLPSFGHFRSSSQYRLNFLLGINRSLTSSQNKIQVRRKKTPSSWDSPVVTYPTTNQSIYHFNLPSPQWLKWGAIGETSSAAPFPSPFFDASWCRMFILSAHLILGLLYGRVDRISSLPQSMVVGGFPK